MNPQSIDSEVAYYFAHQTELKNRYAGKVLVIKQQKVIRVYESENVAFRESQKEFPSGAFLILKVGYPG